MIRFGRQRLRFKIPIDKYVTEYLFNPIPLNILRFRAKTMSQIKGKWQGVPKSHPLEENRVKVH